MTERHDTHRSDPPSASLGSLAAWLGGATLGLAAVGWFGVSFGIPGAPLLPQAALVVSVGGTILTVTVAAIALMATREAGPQRERRRAWAAAIGCGALLVVLVVALGDRAIRTPVVPDTPPQAAVPGSEPDGSG